MHHTADPLKQTVKELETKERNDGYSDMPYHFVITHEGNIYEGRVMAAVGAHAGAFKGNKDITKDPDYGSVGIVLTGDFESRIENGWSPDTPAQAQLASMQRLLNYLVWNYQLPPSSIGKHSEVKRDGEPTACPGEKLNPHVVRGKAAAQRALHGLQAAEEKLRSLQKSAATLK